MTDFLLKHKSIFVVLVIVIVAALWWGFGPTTQTALLAAPAAVSGPEQQVVSTLLSLRTVKLDATIFSEPAFSSLQDFSVPIVHEDVGRPNPFAPLDGGPTALNAASSSQQSRVFKVARPNTQ